jgi:uncharacterized protein with von Willebrand factor type A (vWA) domain
MSEAPVLDGRVIRRAERATRALLERLLVRTGTRVEQWVALNLVTVAGEAADLDSLIEQMGESAALAEAVVREVLDELIAAGLLEAAGDARVRLTGAGRARCRRIGDDLAEVIGRVYEGIAAEDLATTARVLAVVAERANAELPN